MEVSDFRTIIALVESGSISAAAHRLGRVPSAITTRLQNIEHKLGTALFIKENRRFVPTSQGRMLYENALQIVQLVSSVEQQVSQAAPGGTFRLGALDSMAATRLPHPLATLYQRHPDVAVELTTGISSTLYEAILRHELDAAFIANAPQDDRLERIPVFAEELVIITAAGHPPISSPAEIAHQTLLVFQDGCSYRDRLTAWFRQFQVRPHRLAIMSSYHAIVGGVSAGMGIGVVPRPILTTFPHRRLLAIHPFDAAFSTLVTELVWRKAACGANTRALIAILSEQEKGVGVTPE